MHKKLLLGLIGTVIANCALADSKTITTQDYVDTNFQTKIPGHATNRLESVLTDTTTDGVVGKIGLYGSNAADSDIYNAPAYYDAFIPTVGALAIIAASKQDKIPGHAANATDSVLTDSTTAGVVQKRTILDMETFDINYNAGDLITDNYLSNMIPDAGMVGLAVASKQNKMTCTRWLDNAAHTDENCLLWQLNN